ncbi:hypothetical protein SDC9_179367 [bioreactor metagenome]|uniref:Uncharacterized protein n=1 Tax=bioreactor metagenome TaxID=1076179 RepID=A0A645H0R1_9ZZZZ
MQNKRKFMILLLVAVMVMGTFMGLIAMLLSL